MGQSAGDGPAPLRHPRERGDPGAAGSEVCGPWAPDICCANSGVTGWVRECGGENRAWDGTEGLSLRSGRLPAAVNTARPRRRFAIGKTAVSANEGCAGWMFRPFPVAHRTPFLKGVTLIKFGSVFSARDQPARQCFTWARTYCYLSHFYRWGVRPPEGSYPAEAIAPRAPEVGFRTFASSLKTFQSLVYFPVQAVRRVRSY